MATIFRMVQNKMTTPKPVDLEELREKWDALFEVNIQMLNELIHLRTRVKELEDAHNKDK